MFVYSGKSQNVSEISCKLYGKVGPTKSIPRTKEDNTQKSAPT